jgi:Bacterial TniB protein
LEDGVLDVSDTAVAANLTAGVPAAKADTACNQVLTQELYGEPDGTSLLHLHPNARTLAQADDATRLQAITSRRWITHHVAARVLERLREAFEQQPGDRMLNVLLLAESGMGKTMLLRKFHRDHDVPFDAVAGVQRHPVVLMLMPEEPSEDAFYVQLLKAIGVPVSLSNRRHRIGTRETAFRLLREVGTRMLMIDEINSVLVGSARQQRCFLQMLRFLSNELKVALVCAGVPEARFALLADPQIRNRFAETALEPWAAGPDLSAFVTLLVQGLPLRRPSPVDSGKLRRVLVERSGGITQSICWALERAAATAIRNGRELIDLSALNDDQIWHGLGLPARGSIRLRPAALARTGH